jgi:transglutaminase/protease-like cytokinesis protein 3
MIGILILLMLQPFGSLAATDDSGIYEKIDIHAINTPSSAEKSVQSLAAYLVEPAGNEREKARAIFRWIAENIDYNIEDFFSGNIDRTSSGDVLKTRKSVCDGYSDIFQSLANEAGLEATRIVGYGKGYGYHPGQNLSGPSNHAWNAVKINGSWYLIDSTWGAGYISKEKKYVRQFNEHFFMTAPSEFIYDHFPENSTWQLLEKPLSKSEFEQQVHVKSEFFKYGLKIGNHPQGLIKTNKEINISIYAPDDVLLISRLEYEDNKLTPEKLENYAFSERSGKRYDIFAQFPTAGNYLLKVYAKKKDEPGEYHWAIEYAINAIAGNKESTGFPSTYGKFNEAVAYLFSPMEARLLSGKPYLFRIRVPNAKNVSVISGEDWSFLEKEGDFFTGSVTPSKGDVIVSAKFGEDNRYEGLLKYTGY